MQVYDNSEVIKEQINTFGFIKVLKISCPPLDPNKVKECCVRKRFATYILPND